MYQIYTDGGCINGKGAYSVVIEESGALIASFGFSVENTTSNQMELSAFILALYLISNGFDRIPEIISDSKYVIDGVFKYLPNWQTNNWKGSTGKDVKNVEYWKQIAGLTKVTAFSMNHVKGHSGNRGNEQADKICTYLIKGNSSRVISINNDALLQKAFPKLGDFVFSLSEYIQDIKNENDKLEIKNKAVINAPIQAANAEKMLPFYRIVKMPEALIEKEGTWIIFEGFPAKLIKLNSDKVM